MNNLIQAVKACIIIDLEEKFNQIEGLAFYAASLDERIIILERLRDTYTVLHPILQKSIDELTSTITLEQLKYVKRDLSSSDELIIEEIVSKNSDKELKELVSLVKDTLKIK